MKAVVVRARQKPLEELPDWALCCDVIREKYRRNGNSLIVDVVANSAFMAEVKCKYCHRIIRHLKYVRVAEPNPELGECSAIAVECFDFDEGIA